MPRHTLHNRQETLDKALALFWRKGFKATSLKDLEDTLDMRPGSIYASFGSKERLFQEVLQRYGRQGLVELERTLAANPSPLGGLADYLRQLGGLRDTPRPCHACMLVKTLLELGPGGQSALAQELLDSMETRFIDAFEAARDAGELAPEQDPERLGRRFQAQVMGLRAYAERKIDRATLHALADDMADDVERLAVA
ncbi:transcriptional regulator, TetR family [Modicisalibacter ilicicola DSM 19980]|uniref:Transcriptional regulator, TetR family n=1 Tax=Modicisalibacter ilicicola DSM 19980 TaxID=1121942 RepID=A0A1M4WB08_9GAMM|nr:TetR/AcrR family transcriptional regulator [Halomonas ilicicola]SHE78152.1 transcriptional regulator, TetR family [Halomonas ilicicola DSM 19980]